MDGLKNRAKRVKRWMIAALLCICMVMTLIPMEYYGLSITAPGESSQAVQREILSFHDLPAEIRTQLVETGTLQEELVLPDALTAVCRSLAPTPDMQPETESETSSEEPAETETPETGAPDSSETDAPDSSETAVPDPSETDTPDSPETDNPDPSETDTPDSPETDNPDPSETDTPDSSETTAPETPEAPEIPNTPDNSGPEVIPAQPEETVQPEEDLDAKPAKTPSAESASPAEETTIETSTVTIKENYAMPEETSGLKELTFGDPAFSQEQGEETVTIPGISWRSDPPYDSETEGMYWFTPILPPGYALAEGAVLPEISVSVAENGISFLDNALETETEEDLTPAEPACGTVSRDITWGEGTLDSGTLIINPGITLTITGKLTVNGTVTVLGGGAISRGSENAFFEVAMGKQLTLQDITLDGSSIPSPHSMVKARRRSSVTLNGGCKIKNCVKTVSSAESGAGSDLISGGAALYIEFGTAALNDVEITNCTSSTRGGAIYAAASAVTIESGSYSGNSTTEHDVPGGGFIFNDTSKLNINGGSFTGNISAGCGGCIYHSGNSGTETHLNGGYFQGNQSAYAGCEGSGAIWNSSVANGTTTLTLSGSVQFVGDGGNSGTDGIYLDRQNDTPRKVYIKDTLSSPIRIYLEATEDYVIAEGSEYTLLEARDMKKITFIDTGNSGIAWYAKLDADLNQVKIVSTDPNYGLYVTYHSNKAAGTVKDDNVYSPNTEITVMSDKGLTLDGHFFAGWDTKRDGTGDRYMPGDKITLTQDLDLFAIFLQDCTATFYSGGANEFETIDGSKTDGLITAPQLKPMDGYEAVGWDIKPDGYTGGIKPGSAIQLYGDTAYYGVYKKNVTLTYHTEEGTVSPSKKTNVAYANVHDKISVQNPVFTLNSEDSATFAGHALSGWTISPDGSGTLYPPGSDHAFEKDTDLYARWIPNGEVPYTIEHYKQNITGDGYTLSETDTQNLTAPAGTTVSAKAKTFTGFTENASHPERIASGEVAADGSLTLKLYYKRDSYEISFDLHGGAGTVPAPQTVRYQGFLQAVEAPERTGYHFGGWCKNESCDTDSLWNFESPVESNTSDSSVTLHAKWIDDIPPELGEPSFNAGYKNLLNWIVRKKDLIISIPVKEEGEGIKEASYVLEPDGAKAAKRRAAESIPAHVDLDKSLIQIAITEDFKGKITVTCTDNANNPSPETSLTKEDGGFIVEDAAPEIRFSCQEPESSGYFYDSVKITVSVEDAETPDGENTESRISGGIADLFYQIDGGDPIYPSAEESFDNEIVTFCMFDVEIAKYGMPTLSVTATDHAGNHNTRQISVDIRKQQRKYRIEHYTQDSNGETYTKETSETETMTATIGTQVTAAPKTYAGFFENTSHPDRIPSGIVDEDGALVLKLYYDRNLYDIAFDLNGGSGTVPDRQTVRYGNLLQEAAAPARTGYEFKGWYLDQEGTDGRQWNFSRPVERNADQLSVTLYAKWADETAPVLGTASYNKGYRRVLDYIIRKPDLQITVPVTEEGSGVKQANYVLMPDEGSLKEGNAKLETENGQTVAKFSIKGDFAGSVALSATDNAGNVSAEKILTPEDGGVIVEGNAPEITFSTKKGSLSDTFSDSVTVDVSVKDISGEKNVSGGIASVVYKIDGKQYGMSREAFENELLDSFNFSVLVSKTGEHVLSVTAADHAGNKSSRQAKVKIKESESESESAPAPVIRNSPGKPPVPGSEPPAPDNEPQTGDSMHIELYAMIAMIAGFLYLLLLFGPGRTKMTEEDVRQKIKRLSLWAKKGRRIRRPLAMAAAFILLAYYNSIGKAVSPKRKDSYGQ